MTVDGVNLASVKGGPPVLIRRWTGSRWIARAAREFDGWVASAHYGGYDALKAGVERYRAADGVRAIVTNIALDLEAAGQPQDDATPGFDLLCAPDAAAARLGRLADLGFDEAVG